MSKCHIVGNHVSRLNCHLMSGLIYPIQTLLYNFYAIFNCFALQTLHLFPLLSFSSSPRYQRCGRRNPTPLSNLWEVTSLTYSPDYHSSRTGSMEAVPSSSGYPVSISPSHSWQGYYRIMRDNIRYLLITLVLSLRWWHTTLLCHLNL